MSVWCTVCGDEFDPTEVTDVDVPLCSDECCDEYWTSRDIDDDYRRV